MARRILNEKEGELQALISGARWLRFPKAQEKLFHQDQYRKTIVLARVSLGLGLVLNALFAILDDQTLSSSKGIVWFVRYGIASPVVGFCLLLICLPFFKGLAQLTLSMVGITAGFAAISLFALARPEEPGFMLNQATMLLVIMAIYTFLQLRFVYALTIGWLTLFSYMMVAIFYQNSLSSGMATTFFFSNIFYCVIANIMGMFAGYSMELYMRRDFVQRQIIELEQNKSERLLLNILPKEIVMTLKNQPQTIADYYNNVSILFADVVNFTPLSSHLEPAALVELLNEMFSHFDTMVEKYGLEKIKTIGDCYMVAAGVPGARPDHAYTLACLALDMQNYISSRAVQGHCLELRIGINSGPVVAGVIGHKKFSYDLWGDTVNTASRMESHGTKGKIQLTRSTYEMLQEDFICEPNGTINVKGKGELEVWYLVGKKLTVSPVPPTNNVLPPVPERERPVLRLRQAQNPFA